MRLEEWKDTMQTMVDECNHERQRSDRILMEWRVTLEKEPALLKPFQIDEIVREVRHRLSDAS
jgi:hypothetical protein